MDGTWPDCNRLLRRAWKFRAVSMYPKETARVESGRAVIAFRRVATCQKPQNDPRNKGVEGNGTDQPFDRGDDYRRDRLNLGLYQPPQQKAGRRGQGSRYLGQYRHLGAEIAERPKHDDATVETAGNGECRIEQVIPELGSHL